MTQWSLNIWGDTEQPDALRDTVGALVTALGADVQGGSLNITGEAQVTYPAPPADPAAADPAAPSDPATPADPGAPADPAPAPSGPQEGTPDAFAAETVDTLEAELNRRSAEGMAVTSDGSPLQEASAVEIEQEISRRTAPAPVSEGDGSTGGTPAL